MLGGSPALAKELKPVLNAVKDIFGGMSSSFVRKSWCLFVLFIFFSCFKPTHSMLGIKGTTLVLILDARNKQSVDFLDSFLKGVYAIGAPLDIKYAFVKNTIPPIPIPENSIVDYAAIRGFPLKKDHYYLFDDTAALIVDGVLFGDGGDLVHTINRKLSQIPEDNARAKLLAEALKESIESLSPLKNIFRSSRNCFAFYEEICGACESGKVLVDFSRLQERYGQYSFWFVALTSYDAEDVKRVRINLGLNKDLILSDQNIVTWWPHQKQKALGVHPLLGSLIIADRLGTILYIGNDIEDMERWMEEH